MATLLAHAQIEAEDLFSGWEGTLLELISADLKPLIYFYWLFHKRRQARPALKACPRPLNTRCSLHPRLTLLHEFGSPGPQKEGPNLNDAFPRSATFDESGTKFYVSEIVDGKGILQLFHVNESQTWNDPYKLQHQPEMSKVLTQSLFKNDFVADTMAIDFGGHLVAVDQDQARFRVLDPNNGELKAEFGEKGTEKNQMMHPDHLAIDGDGNYMICDLQIARIQVYSPSGAWLRNLGQGLFNQGDPRAMTTDNDGYIYVAQSWTIIILDREGRFIKEFGKGKLRYPHQVLVDRNGLIIVPHVHSGSVQVYSKLGTRLMMELGTETSGEEELEAGGGKHFFFGNMRALVLDKQGQLLLGASVRHTIGVFG